MAYRENSWVNCTKHYNSIRLSSHNRPCSNPLFNDWYFTCRGHASLVPLLVGLVLLLGSYARWDGRQTGASNWKFFSLGHAIRSWMRCILRWNLGTHLYSFHLSRWQFYQSLTCLRLRSQFSFFNTRRVLSRWTDTACMQRCFWRFVCNNWIHLTFCDDWKQ